MDRASSAPLGERGTVALGAADASGAGLGASVARAGDAALTSAALVSATARVVAAPGALMPVVRAAGAFTALRALSRGVVEGEAYGAGASSGGTASTCVGRRNKPWFSGHVKYCLPFTAPLFCGWRGSLRGGAHVAHLALGLVELQPNPLAGRKLRVAEEADDANDLCDAVTARDELSSSAKSDIFSL